MASYWYIFAVGASVLWGLNYVLTEKILQGGVSIFFLMFLSSVVLMVFSLICAFAGNNSIVRHSMDIIQSGKVSLWILAGYICSGFLGWFLINNAILLRNATSASLIEITYPLFVILFAWIFFKDAHLNPYVVLGGTMIVGGSFLVIWKG